MHNIKGTHKGNFAAGKIMGPIWDEFSPSTGRKEHHVFLFDVIQEFSPNNKNVRILETCLGSGIDAIPLAKAGYTLTANEFDPHYRETAKKRIAEEKVEVEIIGYNWLNFDQYQPQSLFDIALCIGNSICYIFGHDQQMTVIRNFKNLIRNGGLLLIDERNFQFMLDNHDEILAKKDSVISNHSGLNKHVLYGSEKYYPYPVEISNDMIVMGLWQQGKMEPISRFYFYPFKRGELLKMLEDVFGKENVDVYSDYRKGRITEAGFYQYVCRKKIIP
ncbi:MAG: class I SAM-dependent methyltransferase [Candidatus Gracilibacteria bacterium]|jgi:SAM-dependent methyltransferase